MEFW